MDIHILHDGQQTGPFTEETVQAMLKQGEILINDLAWHTGMEKWLPLHAVLYPAAQAASTPPPPPPEAFRPPPRELAAEPAPAREPAKAEPASARQKAFLTYLGISFSNDLTKDKAALLVNDAMEDPKNAGRLKKWDEERMRLYPDIFADEIKAKRDNRAQFFLEVCQREGAEFFEGVTKAHTQLLVGYLDVQYPNWDQQEHSAKFDYFFPAISEKFPQVLKKGIKGRFKYPDGPKVAAELVRRPVAVRTSPASSAIGAMFRGVIFGGIVLGMLWVAYQFGTGKLKLPESFAKAGDASSTTVKKPEPTTAPVVKAGDPTPAPKPVVRATPAAAPVAGANPGVPSLLDPAPAVAANNPEMANAAPNSPLPAGVSLFDTTPPPATPPAATDPLVPATPAPAQAVIARVNKPTTVMLKFGSSSIRQGTPVQVVAVEGALTKIRFGPDVVSVPTSNLDLPEGASAPPVPPVPAVPPPAPQ